MIWLFSALAGAAIHAVANFVDKYILEKEIPDYQALPIYTAIVSFVFGTIFWLIAGFPLLSLRDGAIVLTTGILSAFGLVFYFKALTVEETSRVIILFQMTPVIALALSFLFLKEAVTTTQFIGFLLILAATTLISFKKNPTDKTFSAGFFYILLFDFLQAIASILVKYTINLNSFKTIVAWESWGLALGGAIIYLLIPSLRKAFHQSLLKITKRAIGILTLNDMFFIAGKLFFFFGFSQGPVALVKVLEGTQTFFGILYGWLLHLAYPAIFKEKITRHALTNKLIAALLLLEGIILISQ